MEFDLIRLTDEHRHLILNVSPPGASKVYLDPLDKGLSGATVWLAQWDMPQGVRSAPSVLKINIGTKIYREFRAYEDIVQHLDGDVGAFRQFLAAEGNHLSILVQPFKGDPDTFEIQSLRSFLGDLVVTGDARQLVDRIYLHRMRHWHPVLLHQDTVKQSLLNALDWWTSRYNFLACVESLGRTAIGNEIETQFHIDASSLDDRVHSIMRKEILTKIGPVHGDLHSQNILIERDTNRVHLIDFGWTGNKWKAVDFLMLECSLKFLALPFEVRSGSFLEMESILERYDEAEVEERLINPLFPHTMKAICAAIAQIRHICCNRFKYVSSFEEYRMGLIVLTAALAGYKGLNRRFLVNSLAYHVQRHMNVSS